MIFYLSYVIVENLRYMLSQYNPKTALVFGHRYASISIDEGYMAGGAYVLSKKALKKFGEKLVHNDSLCHITGEAEDLEMGMCLAHSAIFVDCRDELHQKRFFPAGAEEHMRHMNDLTYWYTRAIYYYSPDASTSCCSDTSVQFHYIPPLEMYVFEYFIYKVHPFGLVDHPQESLPRKLTLEEIIKASDANSSSPNFKVHKDFHYLESSEIY